MKNKEQKTHIIRRTFNNNIIVVLLQPPAILGYLKILMKEHLGA
jgi:hypothetical protein